MPQAGTRVSEGAGEDEEEQASVARRPARPARGDRCSLNPCLSGGACRPSELPPGCARTGLILPEHEGAGEARRRLGSEGRPWLPAEPLVCPYPAW